MAGYADKSQAKQRRRKWAAWGASLGQLKKPLPGSPCATRPQRLAFLPWLCNRNRLMGSNLSSPGRSRLHLPQKGRDELHKLCPGDHLLVENHQAAEEVFVCFCAAQSFADLGEREEIGCSRGEINLSSTVWETWIQCCAVHLCMGIAHTTRMQNSWEGACLAPWSQRSKASGLLAGHALHHQHPTRRSITLKKGVVSKE